MVNGRQELSGDGKQLRAGGVIDILALWGQQQTMPAEYSAVVDKRFWELIDADGKDNK